MKYAWLSTTDQRFNNWVFYTESNESGIRLREEYLPLQCKRCKKIDELAALEIGVSAEFRVQSRSDYLTTDDGLVCVSVRGQQIMQEAQVVGIRFLPLPGEDRYSILLPTQFVPVDREKAGMKILRLCQGCNRPRETCGLPALASLSLPEEQMMTLCCPELVVENSRGCELVFLAMETISTSFRKAKLSGVEYLAAR